MQNILQNKLQQNWRNYSLGLKVRKPLGGDLRKMGAKRIPVVSATGSKVMQFTYMHTLSTFRNPDRNYIPPYKPLPGSESAILQPQYSPPYDYANDAYAIQQDNIPPGLTYDEYKQIQAKQRADEKTQREDRRESRRNVADVRATYRTVLDTAREGRGWFNTLGI